MSMLVFIEKIVVHEKPVSVNVKDLTTNICDLYYTHVNVFCWSSFRKYLSMRSLSISFVGLHSENGCPWEAWLSQCQRSHHLHLWLDSCWGTMAGMLCWSCGHVIKFSLKQEFFFLTRAPRPYNKMDPRKCSWKERWPALYWQYHSSRAVSWTKYGFIPISLYVKMAWKQGSSPFSHLQPATTSHASWYWY